MIKYVFGGSSLGTDKSSIFRMGIKTRKACDGAILYVDIHPTAKTTLPAECLNGTVFDNCVYIHLDSEGGFRDNPTDPIKKLVNFRNIEGGIGCQRLFGQKRHSRGLIGNFTGFKNVQICAISLFLQIFFGDES